MPYHVEENGGGCPSSVPWAVINDTNQSLNSCHISQDSAAAQVEVLSSLDEPTDTPEEVPGTEMRSFDLAAAVTGAPVSGTPVAAPPKKGVNPFPPKKVAAAGEVTYFDDAGVPVTGAPVSGSPIPAPDPIAEAAVMTSSSTVPWEGVVAMEGTATGDGREFAPESLTWANLPLPLRWLKEDTHGGIQVNGVVSVGRIDTLTRRGSQIYGTGVLDVASADGQEVARRMGTQQAPGFLSGISIDADDPAAAQVEYVYPPGCPPQGVGMAAADPAANPADMEKCMIPSKTIFHSGRIRAATLCDIPAFVEAQVYLSKPFTAADDSSSEDMSDGMFDEIGYTASLIAAAHTITIPDLPPIGWFIEPEEAPEIGALTITDDGRIFGYLAPRGVAHRSYGDRRVTVPLGVDYSRWMNRVTITSDGTRIATGPITMGCGHANPQRGVGSAQAMDHYDNSCSIVATARVGENRNGVWIAGALMSDVDPSQVARMLACQLSGDWRPNKDRPGTRELCGALLVPVPGFPMAASERGMRIRTEYGNLVASSVPVFKEGWAPSACSIQAPTVDLSLAARIVARSIGLDRGAKLKQLAAKVHAR